MNKLKKMKPIIETEEENKVALAFVERLMDSEPEKGSEDGTLLSLLADKIVLFEKRYATLPPLRGEEK